MSTSDRLRRILVPTPQFTPCKICGEMLNSLEGHVFDNCKDWAEFAASQMPQPMSYSMFLPILLMKKLCRLEKIIGEQNSFIHEAMKD